ncbi:metallothionein-like protein type 2 isoform X2 [Amborella trichopoda]|uniref:Metallothionein-like protein n=1 Tax=Amborella trichopoda TaxID=13333 RepID=W1PL35_AMBTC|nr:metallothionein-like protein type 2 isoform X2 [Amborella trichopoda]ERN07845.1 hypothetical protein AMTR_s00012p00200670 [Amborella trichopoda]|eukprot:XP_006846170.1 metallothionein-like protein type 2 isoform X2 [Amborella trichopoda]
MSCCGGNCGCGAGCQCGSGCGGCNMYPDLHVYGERTVEARIVEASSEMGSLEVYEMNGAAENGCKCGSNCTCDPCNCK